MGRVTISNRLLQEKKDNLKASGFDIEIVPTSDNEQTGDMWIILSKNEIHITHRVSDDVLSDDKMLYHCLNVMEQEHERISKTLRDN